MRSSSLAEPNRRILVVDDNRAIHDDLRKILIGEVRALSDLQDDESLLFGARPAALVEFELASAYQGREALAMVEQSLAEGRPFALAFVDVRMPPGWDGVETISRLWRVDCDLQVVICTAYSDYSWSDILRRLGSSDNLVVLKKPFDNIEAIQLAHSLTRKWLMTRQARIRMEDLNRMVALRTAELESANAELERQRGHLEEQVAARTLELSELNRSLRLAKEAAEQASRAKSAFLATMSHELRTPLNAIIGYSEMLIEEAQDRAQPEFIPDLQKICVSGRHLLELIDDALDISRIEADRMELHLEVCNAGDLIADAISAVEPMAGKNRNKLEVSCGDPGMRVRADRLRFRQVLVNLLGNACKFTEDGTVRLEVVRSRGEDGGLVCWRVRDTGIGIAPEQLGKLFRAFTQVDSSMARKYGGTGLGLAISQQLCRLMGGWITVESEPGRGSTFTIHMPAAGEGAMAEDLRQLGVAVRGELHESRAADPGLLEAACPQAVEAEGGAQSCRNQ
jgi:signal transduction histidine kinase